jgi:flagellar hook-associated protein 3 FlgL
MRVTQRAVALTSLQGLYTNLSAVNKLQQQLTSGKTISVPPDDPTGTNTALAVRQAIAGNAQQARNISDGQAFLNATDSTLQSMVALVQQVRTLTVQASNSGSMGDTAEQNIATEVRGLRADMLAQANTGVQGRPLFGGATSGSQAYDPTTGQYEGVGDGTDQRLWLTRRVSDAQSIRADITGPEAFGDPNSGKDLFSVVQNIADHATSNPAALSGDLADLDAVLDRLSTAQADIGTRSAAMNTAADVNSSQQLTLQSQQSQVEDIDLPKTIMDLQMQQNSYQAALSATAKALQPTLVDFLK